MSIDKIKGSLLSLAIGDALGAPFEGGLLEKAAWKALGKNRGQFRYTDDTQMSIDIAKSLIACGGVDQDDMARRFSESFEWSRGYGPGAAKLLKRIKGGVHWQEACRSVFKDGSFGNGAAMRAGPVGLFFSARPVSDIVDAATKSAVITHAHPLGVEGAVLIAVATAYAVKDEDNRQIVTSLLGVSAAPEFKEKLRSAREALQTSVVLEDAETRRLYGNGIAAHDSVVTAVYSALSHREQPFEALLAYVRGIGGDVDTIGAMAGAIWGAVRGYDALPKALLRKVEGHEDLETLAKRLAETIN